MGKARVAPLRSITIPRLELTAAVVSTRVSLSLKQDSSWLKGPRFLWSSDEYSAPEPFEPVLLDLQDPEVKTASTLVTQSAESFPKHFETNQLNSFSDWFRAKTAVALCLPLKGYLKKRIKEKTLQGQERRFSEDQGYHCQRPKVEDLAHADLEIIRSLQSEHFKDEIKVLQSLNVDGEFVSRMAAKERIGSLRKISCLYRLDPYFDGDGILRVGGRLRRAN